MREINSLYRKIAILSNPEISGLTRSNTKILCNDDDPVYVLSKSLPIRMAETSLIPTQPNDAAYYRSGFYTNLPTSYTTIDEGYPTLVITAQILRAVSTSANDTSGGTGIQQVLIGGIDANNNRFFEVVTFNGIPPVTQQPISLDSLISLTRLQPVPVVVLSAQFRSQILGQLRLSGPSNLEITNGGQGGSLQIKMLPGIYFSGPLVHIMLSQGLS